MSSTRAETSFLSPIGELETALREAGFEIERKTDRTDFALEFFQCLRREADGSPRPLGLHLLMGEDFPAKAANILLNIERGACAPWEIVCRSL